MKIDWRLALEYFAIRFFAREGVLDQANFLGK
jgi:hypothetical protein